MTGEGEIVRVQISMDEGKQWHDANLGEVNVGAVCLAALAICVEGHEAGQLARYRPVRQTVGGIPSRWQRHGILVGSYGMARTSSESRLKYDERFVSFKDNSYDAYCTGVDCVRISATPGQFKLLRRRAETTSRP